MVVQQLSVYWSVCPPEPPAAAASSGHLSSPAPEPASDGASDEQQLLQLQQEDLILQPMDCVLLLKLQSAGADTCADSRTFLAVSHSSILCVSWSCVTHPKAVLQARVRHWRPASSFR